MHFKSLSLILLMALGLWSCQKSTPKDGFKYYRKYDEFTMKGIDELPAPLDSGYYNRLTQERINTSSDSLHPVWRTRYIWDSYSGPKRTGRYTYYRYIEPNSKGEPVVWYKCRYDNINSPYDHPFEMGDIVLDASLYILRYEYIDSTHQTSYAVSYVPRYNCKGRKDNVPALESFTICHPNYDCTHYEFPFCNRLNGTYFVKHPEKLRPYLVPSNTN